MSLFFERVHELLYAPVDYPNMLWMVLPLASATLLMTFYYGKYKEEELGWSSAFANSMVFLFVAIDIFRVIYQSTDPPSFYNLIDTSLYFGVTIFLFSLGALLMAVNYYHALPKQFDFILCSGPPVNMTVYTVLCIVYANVPADLWTVLAALVVLIILAAILRIMQLIQRLLTGELITKKDDIPVKVPEEKKPIQSS